MHSLNKFNSRTSNYFLKSQQFSNPIALTITIIKKYSMTFMERLSNSKSTIQIVIILLGLAYLSVQFLGTACLIVLAIMIACMRSLLVRKWSAIRKEGIINILPAKIKIILLERSIVDIFSDLLYFPLVSNIIATFIRATIVKPKPEDLSKQFEHLPEGFKAAISTKGLLHLAPSKVEELMLREERAAEDIPKVYGQKDWSWNNKQLYYQQEELVHEQSIGQTVLQKIDQKITVLTVIPLVVVSFLGARHMNTARFKKMMIQNTTFLCMVMALIVLLFKLKKWKEQKKNLKRPKSYVKEILEDIHQLENKIEDQN